MSLSRDTADYGHIKTARKNLLLNGDFDIAQRGTTFSAHPAGDYTLDRWFTNHAGTMVYSCYQLGTTSDLPFRHYHRVDVDTADTSLAATDYVHFTQKVEGYNIHHLNWGQASAKDLTISFWHRHTKTGTYSVSIRNSDASRCYVREYTQSVTNEWEESTVTFPGCTDGTWQEDENTGLVLSFAAASGTTYAGSADSWLTTSNIFASTNQVNAMDSTSNVFDIAHVQLEVGTEATDWDFRSIAEELAACQRYFISTISSAIGFGVATSATEVRSLIPTPTAMRGTPTLGWSGVGTIANVSCRGNGQSMVPTSTSNVAAKPNGVQIYWIGSGLTSTNHCFDIYCANYSLEIEAEL